MEDKETIEFAIVLELLMIDDFVEIEQEIWDLVDELTDGVEVDLE